MVFTPTVVAALAMTGLWLVALISVTPVLLWLERRAPAFMQDRLGPNRLGPLGLFQAIADVLKFIFKEDSTRPAPTRSSSSSRRRSASSPRS